MAPVDTVDVIVVMHHTDRMRLATAFIARACARRR